MAHAEAPLSSGPSAAGSAVLSNAGVLLAGQLLGLVAPLLTVPYLARTLGPDAWGPVLLAQALANWLLIVLEFGFDLSGTREVARSRHAPEFTSSIVRSVQSAKLLLVLVAVPVAFAIALAIPGLRASFALVGAALVFAVSRGLSPLWYFQGVERMRGAVTIDSLNRVCAALGVFWLVHEPDDAWRVLGLQAFFSVAALIWLSVRLASEVTPERPSLSAARRTLRSNFTVFACRASSGIYIQANALLLGIIAPATVAFFGGAEKIVRAAINLLQPLNQAFLPRLSFLQRSDPAAADRLIRRSFIAVGAFGAIMSLVAVFGAQILVRVLLGPGYESAVPALRLMAVLPFLVSINGVLGIFWAIPFGHERGFLAAILGAGFTNVALALFLVPRFGTPGMAVAAVAAEVVVLAVLGSLYLRRRPFRESSEPYN